MRRDACKEVSIESLVVDTHKLSGSLTRLPLEWALHTSKHAGFSTGLVGVAILE